MKTIKNFTLTFLLLLFFAAGCGGVEPQPTALPTAIPETATALPTFTVPPTSTATLIPTETLPPTATPFEVGRELTVDYLLGLEITGSEITFEQQINDRVNYHQYIVSYLSEGNKIFGLLTVPFDDPPEGGYKAVVFCHGYIPPSDYQTRERYDAYVDFLARRGLVVFKIDYRGHGQSEGVATGSYFSPDYTIDAISALKSLQTLETIDPQGIGMWGHSMAGNLVLRAMLMEPDIQAGVIWAGAVYSYDDFAQYGISDTSYRPSAANQTAQAAETPTGRAAIFSLYGPIDTESPYWQAVSLTEHLETLNSPLQIHHAEDDPVVNVGYSMGLASILKENGKAYEFYIYEGGGHNIISPYFDEAMQRTYEFYLENL